jgi:dihydrofolate reductase
LELHLPPSAVPLVSDFRFRRSPLRRQLSTGDVRDRRNRQRDGSGEGRAGDRNLIVHGAYTAQRALEAGVLDELQIHQIPVLFGGGRRMFEVLPSRVELEIVRVIDTPEATHIRYRVRR